MSTNFQPIILIIGILLLFLAISMLVPAGVEYALTNKLPAEFLAASLIASIAGTMAILAVRNGKPIQLDIRQAFILTALCWLVLPAFAALPFLGLGIKDAVTLSYTDAVFEAVSGVTTTGSTVMVGLDNQLPGILLWRSILNWIGGVGIVVMALIMLPFLRVGGMQLFKMESSDKSEKIVPKSIDLVKKIVMVYVILTVACITGYILTGMTLFDAVNHAMATLATGGYSTHDNSFRDFGYSTQWVGVVFMILGAMPFSAFIALVHGKGDALHKNSQIKAFIRFLFITILLATLLRLATSDADFVSALTETAFNIVSVVTTTGFASTDYTLWGTAAVAGFFLLTFVGGCAGSTSGAIKIYRFQVLWITLRQQLRRLISPHHVVLLNYDGKRMSDDLPLSVLAFLAAFFATIAIIALLLAFMGVDFMTAISASLTAVTNVGPGLGDMIGPSGNFQQLPNAAKWVLSLAMLLGRLEIFTLILLFEPHFWRN